MRSNHFIRQEKIITWTNNCVRAEIDSARASSSSLFVVSRTKYILICRFASPSRCVHVFLTTQDQFRHSRTISKKKRRTRNGDRQVWRRWRQGTRESNSNEKNNIMILKYNKRIGMEGQCLSVSVCLFVFAFQIFQFYYLG